ncbi:MAG: hypothetical protein ACP5N2_03105 [Candidatus Nanoarchaeia archaeon]
MYPSELSTMLQWANVFISFFIIIIAYFFFQKTKPHKNRTPWVILFIAVIMFFIFEISNAIRPNMSSIPELKDFFKTLFVGFVLYVFVYEHYLIEHSNTIVIEKKEQKIKVDEEQKPQDNSKPVKVKKN